MRVGNESNLLMRSLNLNITFVAKAITSRHAWVYVTNLKTSDTRVPSGRTAMRCGAIAMTRERQNSKYSSPLLARVSLHLQTHTMRDNLSGSTTAITVHQRRRQRQLCTEMTQHIENTRQRLACFRKTACAAAAVAPNRKAGPGGSPQYPPSKSMRASAAGVGIEEAAAHAVSPPTPETWGKTKNSRWKG